MYYRYALNVASPVDDVDISGPRDGESAYARKAKNSNEKYISATLPSVFGEASGSTPRAYLGGVVAGDSKQCRGYYVVSTQLYIELGHALSKNNFIIIKSRKSSDTLTPAGRRQPIGRISIEP